MTWLRYVRDYKYYACKLLDRMELLEHLSFDIENQAHGHTFRIPIRSGVGYYNLARDKENWLYRILERLHTTRRGACIDVGVNLGQTLLKVAALDRTAEYYGFEPNPICYAYARSLIDANELSSFKVFPVGLSTKSEIVQLFGDRAIASGASILADFRKDKSRHKPIHVVPVATADSVLSKEAIAQINYMKVDVEGAELLVMQGARATIAKFRPIIVMEILPVYDVEHENGRMRKQRQDQLLALMDELDYGIYLVREETARLKPLTDIGVHGDMRRTNYVLVPHGDKTLDDLVLE